MNKEKHTLAFDIIKAEKKRTAFWFVSFVITFTVIIVKHFSESEVR